MSEYDDDAERLSEICDICGETFYTCKCGDENEDSPVSESSD